MNRFCGLVPMANVDMFGVKKVMRNFIVITDNVIVFEIDFF